MSVGLNRNWYFSRIRFKKRKYVKKMSEFKMLYELINSEVFKRHNTRVPCQKTIILNIVEHNCGNLEAPKKLMYFKKPLMSSYPLNLNLGFENYKFREENYFKYNLKLTEHFLMKCNRRALLRNSNKQVICTSRNALRVVMETPYKMRLQVDNTWTIRAIKFNDVIYLVNRKHGRTSKSKPDTYHYKFRQYCFSDNPYSYPNTGESIDENIQTSCFFRKGIADFDLFYSGEVVGVESEHELQNICSQQTLRKCRFVTTKLLKDPSNSQHNWKTHPKMLHWWTQSFLGARENIYCGFKTQNGFVDSPMRFLKYEDLPKNQKWKPQVCERFLLNFLTKVKNELSMVNDPHTVFEFKFEPTVKLVKYRILEGDPEDVFLSNEFIQYMQMA